VERTLQGEQAAFAQLYQRYRGTVHAIALARLSPDEAGDLVQDVFERALGRLKKLKKRDSFRSWLLMITRNRAMDFHRARKPAGDDPDLVAQSAAPRAEARQILALIHELPDAYRETLIMRFVEGMTGPEIAQRTGLKPESVRVNLHRGMKLLREALTTENPKEKAV
jgi:RNA polymerase sigma-70 factor (ECF subfamily)